ncbi:MAG: hypothetical protein JKY95_11885 [Planctomycetaceae bacterium]|nr:hypothetical protein [Planctomycetaceae bacterium]
MKTHRFIIYFSGCNELSSELANAVYEAGCDDGSLSLSEFRFRVCFDREAESFADAVFSAFRDLKKVPRLQVTEIEAESEEDMHDVGLMNRMLKIQQEASAV